MNTTESQAPFTGDDILRLMQDEIINRVRLVLRGGPAAGLRLQVPDTNIFIIAGPTSWIVGQAADLHDQPSAGQVDDRACSHVWNDFGQLGGRNVVWCPRCNTLAWTGKEPEVRASLTPTAPQAASQQAASIRTLEFVSLMNAWRNADPLTGPAAYDAITAHIDAKLRAPQAATTASASEQFHEPSWQNGYKTGYETGLGDGRAEFTNPAATSPAERAPQAATTTSAPSAAQPTDVAQENGQ